MPAMVLAQNNDYSVKKTSSKIILDGKLDEQVWMEAQSSSAFMQYFPNDDVEAIDQTEVKFTYDEDNFYFCVKVKTIEGRTYVVPSLRRDYRGAIDGVTLVIDPFQDNTNAFFFGVNALGVMREGLITNGGMRFGNFGASWDNKWKAQSIQGKDYWTIEAAIPFKTLRYKAGTTKWNVNLYRLDSRIGERSTWTPIQRNFNIFGLAFMKEIVFERPLSPPGPNISVIPYTSLNANQDFDANDASMSSSLSFGGDAKIGIGSGLNLDLTANPDFSQVEVDNQVTNLSRFELFFPERRQFFLENADLFQDFGHPFLARPFFSRRIGITVDTVTDVNVQTPIHYGARLSGKLDNNTRIGLLNMQTAREADIGLPTLNYTVAVLQRKIFARSNIGAFFVNKESFDKGELDSANLYNRVIGVDYNIASGNGKWNGKVFLHKSFDNEKLGDDVAHTGWISYQSKGWFGSWAHVYIGDNYNAEVGYVPRNGIFRVNPDLGFNIFKESGIFNRHQFTGEAEFFWNDTWGDFKKTDHKYGFSYEASFQNTARLECRLEQNYTLLLDGFDPSGTGSAELPVDSSFVYNNFSAQFRSDSRKLFNYDLGITFGEWFNGDLVNLSGNFNYRFQPIISLGMRIDYNGIRLPNPYADADLLLVAQRTDLTFTKKLFLTNFIQYNSQGNNLNINTRLQYRFAPVSDLFIVYTDNYNTSQLGNDYQIFNNPTNRALILKLTYWFNI